MEALAYLRLGEQENCLYHHNPESCLLPIRGSGEHLERRGSRNAMQHFAELAEDRNDLGSRWLLNIAAMTLGEYPDGVPERLRVPAEVFESEYPLERFPEIGAQVGLAIDGLAGAAISEDFDGDGLLDVLLTSWGVADQCAYLRNLGDGQFTNATEQAGLTGVTGGLNAMQADYNNDGWTDFYITRGAWLGEPGRVPDSLLRNNGDGTFADVTLEAGLLSFHPVLSAVWLDANNDGFLDFYVGTGAPDFGCLLPNEMLRNNAGREFQDVTTAGGFGHLQKGHGISFADLNNDGQQDVLANMGGAFTGDNFFDALFANPGHTNRWLTLKLVGDRSNRSAIGARVKVVSRQGEGRRAVHRVVGSGGSFGASPLRQEIGLGAATVLERVEIWWPATGTTNVYEELEMDRFYELREDTTNAVKLAPRRFAWPAAQM